MKPMIPLNAAEIHSLACNFITRLNRCKPHPLRVFYEAGEPPRLRTCRRLAGTKGAVRDPVGAVLVGVYTYPTGFARFKHDLLAAIEAGDAPPPVLPAPPPANPRKLTPDGFPTEAVNDFCSYLLKAKAIAAYWSPSRGRVAFRAVRISERQPTALPPDAALVGNFTHPCPRDVFAEALRETINEHKSQQVPA